MSNTPKKDELDERQRKYDELADWLNENSPLSQSTFDLHKRIVRIMDGKEDDPRNTQAT